MPEYAYMYAVAYEDYQNYKLRRYGFHGTSHKYVSQEAAAYLKRNINSLKIIPVTWARLIYCGGKRGKSVDTSMGFTPLEGSYGHKVRRY
jgi:acetate kinase